MNLEEDESVEIEIEMGKANDQSYEDNSKSVAHMVEWSYGADTRYF